MRHLIALSIFTIGILGVSCEKDQEKNNFLYEATVIGKGLDCGNTFIISLKNKETQSNIEDGTYYADNLDPGLKQPGLKIYLNCREPENTEFYACTTLGITYPHVIVTDSQKAE